MTFENPSNIKEGYIWNSQGRFEEHIRLLSLWHCFLFKNVVCPTLVKTEGHAFPWLKGLPANVHVVLPDNVARQVNVICVVRYL